MYVKTVCIAFCNSIRPQGTLNVCMCKLDVCLMKAMNVFVCYSWLHQQLLAAVAAGSHTEAGSH